MLTIDVFNKRICCAICGRSSNASIGIQECAECYERHCDTDGCHRAHQRVCEREPTFGMQKVHDQLWNEPELPVVFERAFQEERP